MSNADLNAILRALSKPARPKIFVSYQHHGDQRFYDEFSRFFHDTHEAVRDNSLEREIDSDDSEYVMRRIREQYITGTSCTIVLIGAHTHERKFVDWEIKASLDKGHGLVGIALPTASRNALGEIVVPERFLDNYVSGYAAWDHWSGLTLANFRALIVSAQQKQGISIRNQRPLKTRNG